MVSPSCSVVVSTRHRAQSLARCLEHLVALEHSSYEIIVVDNSKGDEQVRARAERFGARYIHDGRPGLSCARNAGACAANGEIVAFIDDDAVADVGWLRAHEHALRDRSLVATTGRILPFRPATEPALAHAAKGGDDLGAIEFRIDRRTPKWFEIANFGGVGLGGNLALRRSLFVAGWGFREDLGLGAGPPGEEHYAFFELLLTGHGIAYVPQAVVWHEPPATPDDLRERTWRTLRGSSAYMAMLLVEEPGFRWETLKYAITGLRDTPRAWRTSIRSERFAGRCEVLAAALAGPAQYVRSRAPGVTRRVCRTSRRRALETNRSAMPPYAPR